MSWSISVLNTRLRGSAFQPSLAPSQRGAHSHTTSPRALPFFRFWVKAPQGGPPRQTQAGRVQQTHRRYPQGNGIWPTARFSFRSMGPEYCRHAQMSAVTSERKAPPQHEQTPVTLSQSQHLGGKRGEKSYQSGWLERVAIVKHDSIIQTTQWQMEKWCH